MSKQVLITGVAGFIGSNLLDYLLKNTDWHITGIDNLSTGSKENIEPNIPNSRFTFLEQKCSDVTTLKPFQVVFHLAALPRIQPSFELINDHIKANLIEAIYLIELMIQEKHYPKLVYSGSSSIYGNPENFPTTENERIDCLSPYAFQKYEVEVYLKLISERYPLNYITLRYFNPYGPRSFNPKNAFNAYSSVIGIFIHAMQNGKTLKITGDGLQRRDFVHVADVAKANFLAAQTPDYINDYFNVGSGKTFSILEIAQMLSEQYEFIAKREGEAQVTWADVSKIQSVLGWNPEYDVTDYISEVKNLS